MHRFENEGETGSRSESMSEDTVQIETARRSTVIFPGRRAFSAGNLKASLMAWKLRRQATQEPGAETPQPSS
jgi:hypothetical protein